MRCLKDNADENAYHCGFYGIRSNMKQGISTSYRVAVASRAIAGILGGYGLAALATGCVALALARWTGMARAEAVVAASLLSFLWYALAVIWVFAVDSAWRAWIGLAVPCAVLGLGWLALRSA
ncbi:hypothetical protein D3C87_1152770 [compost metagenome]|nr:MULTISPECIES: DUF3649 domain-containing protein [Cupriavidus]CAG2129781.1 hypothetical protein LMG19282_00232 [Cupriavidus campinensis]